MSGLPIPVCVCGHPQKRHTDALGCDLADTHCGCLAFDDGKPAPTVQNLVSSKLQASAETKRCPKCGQTKIVADFYVQKGRSGRGNLSGWCKKCCNTRPQGKATSPRLIRNRARHRAMAELVRIHKDEFERLVEEFKVDAAAELQRLAEAATDVEAYQAEPVRLRPGRRQNGQSVEDRIDVARCPQCIGYHDRGHVCGNCGAAPSHEHSVAS